MTTTAAELVRSVDTFDLVAGCYWYCADYHGGQGTAEYRFLSTCGYLPGYCERCADGGAVEVYGALERGDVTLAELQAASPGRCLGGPVWTHHCSECGALCEDGDNRCHPAAVVDSVLTGGGAA
jgi:hypothetical protein